MSGDVVYADLQTIRASPLEHSSPVPRPDSHHHGILLKIGCTMIIVLLVIIIMLSIFVSSNSSTTHKLCPNKDWKLHGGKCYWVDTHRKSWTESRNDCVTKNSQLMVIRDFVDVSFLWLHLSHSDYYWIGLRVPTKGKPWTWVDNSSFDAHLFSIEERKPWTWSTKCAQVSRINIIGKKCEDRKQWICQL
ncbi:killer cell lectin-like receptor subfamily B member 1B allele B isoform X3 [Sturnira hondurensis]|uniref:killer cell lectin-like receptor subfamily B member 1B allele B isoform X3 n=1 Tax=Sturnira hondurensis TaxID=192404 RepID=UPI001879C40D|nr:killer cell lectin-like receptor subfamily B member 1B allele B isoform X3 [Sturnira hondurensis]